MLPSSSSDTRYAKLIAAGSSPQAVLSILASRAGAAPWACDPNRWWA